jgi:allantoin racemase
MTGAAETQEDPGSPVAIWHQSLTELERLPDYAAQLQRHANASVRPETRVDIHGVAAGTYPDGTAPIEALEYPACEYLLNIQILDNARKAEEQGYDAFALGCFFDPVLPELRSAVDMPVVSVCESTMVMSMAAGCRYGLLGSAGVNRDRLLELIARYGFTDRVAAVVEIEPSLTEDELDRAFTDPRPLLPRVEQAAKRCSDASADLLIPAEGVLNSMLTRSGIRSLGGLPLLDAYAALLAHAEALVWMARRTGLRTSRHSGYARAPRGLMDTTAARAAEVLHERSVR